MSAYAEEYQAYWDAIQQRACAVCLDVANLPLVVDAIEEVKSGGDAQ